MVSALAVLISRTANGIHQRLEYQQVPVAKAKPRFNFNRLLRQPGYIVAGIPIIPIIGISAHPINTRHSNTQAAMLAAHLSNLSAVLCYADKGETVNPAL